MSALATLLPVVFMIGLGFVAREKKWVSVEQKDGANAVIFNLLFPMMIFNIILKASVSFSSIYIIGYVFGMYVLAMIVGKLLGKVAGNHAELVPFLMTTCEGGSVALPLYLSIVGSSSNTVLYDIAGMGIAFVLIPVIVSKKTAQASDPKAIVKAILTNSFVIAVILGLGLNLFGFYPWMERTGFAVVYDNIATMVTSPIVGMILFIIGYNLVIDQRTLVPVMKMLVLRIGFYLMVIAGFFVIFPELMADSIYKMGVFIYFMSPTGFAIPMLISPLYKNSEDEAFSAGVLSLMMVVTLVVYVGCVLFIA
ncbi:MAG: transporter [Erysipelotrichaceae bacterium]|nr:transporter [Erysipelotrichaceae bacterium]